MTRQSLPSFDDASTSDRQVLFELGSGGMGTAYLARTTGIGGFEKLVVVKRLHPHLLNNAQAVQRFLDEARLAAHVRHANVVSTHRVGRDSEGYFLELDYIEGASLEEMVDRAAVRGERLPVPVVLRIALDALAGLHATHTARDSRGRSLELLHRDVSLQNILIGRDGTARVADFGVAKSALGSAVTDDGYVLGKLLYLSPEYLQHEKPGPELDVYALGVTLWIAFSGNEPWPETTGARLVTRVLDQGLPPLSNVMEVAPRIEELVARACHRHRSERFPTPRAMMAEIEAIARETGWAASHAEVGECVEALAGTDLERRRTFISERLRDVTSIRPPSGSEAIPLVTPASTGPSRDDSAGPTAIPIQRSRLGVPFAIVGMIGLALAGAGVTHWVTTSASASSAPTRQSSAEAPRPSISEEHSSAPVPSSSVPPPVPEASQKTTARPAIPPPTGTRRKAPSAPPPATGPLVAPPPTSDGISTRNPYRH